MTCRSRRKRNTTFRLINSSTKWNSNGYSFNTFRGAQVLFHIMYTRHSHSQSVYIHSSHCRLNIFINSIRFHFISFHFPIAFDSIGRGKCLSFATKFLCILVRETCCHYLSLNRCRSSYGESLPSSSTATAAAAATVLLTRFGCLFIVAVSCDMRYMNRIKATRQKLIVYFGTGTYIRPI